MPDVLGLDHPLTQACEALDSAVRQLLVAVAMLAGSVAAAAQGAPWGRSAALAAAVVLVGSCTLAALRAQTRRDRAIDVLIAGLERVPVAVVQRQRRRLAGDRTRRRIARTLELMVEETLLCRRPVSLSSRPLLHPRVIAAVQDELRAIAALLRSDGATPRSESALVRGVALCERLVTMGESALYGRDVHALRGELRRARNLLSDG